MLIWILIAAAILLAAHLLVVVVVAEFSVHPPIVRRTCDTDGMALHVAATTGATPQLVKIESSDGITLSAWWLKLPSGKAALLCHGVADTALGVMGAALMYLRNGYSVLAPDNRGHGSSGGFVTYGVREAGDIAAWRTWLSGQGVASCFGFGQSLGASSLLQSLSAGAQFVSIVAECPYSSFERVAWDRIAKVNRLFLPTAVARFASNLWVKEVLLYLRLRYSINLHLARPIDAVTNTQIPILLIHGTGDLETPVHHSQEIAARNPEHIQVWIVPGAQHTGSYPVDPASFEKQVLRMLGTEGTTTNYVGGNQK